MCTHSSDERLEPNVDSDADDKDEGWLDDSPPNEDLQDGVAPSVDSEAPEEIAALYNLCINYVQRALGMTLDFTDETLPVLDYYVSIARDSARDRPEIALLLHNAIGAYFGELVRRRLHGHWLIPNPDVYSWRVCARFVFLSINPVGVAYEALAQGDEHGGPSGELHLAHEDQPIIAERLAMAPPVPEAHYYLLTTRLEAIDIAVEALRLAMQRGGHAAVEFDVDDYERVGH